MFAGLPRSVQQQVALPEGDSSVRFVHPGFSFEVYETARTIFPLKFFLL